MQDIAEEIRLTLSAPNPVKNSELNYMCVCLSSV